MPKLVGSSSFTGGRMPLTWPYRQTGNALLKSVIPKAIVGRMSGEEVRCIMDWRTRIVVDPAVLVGKPVI